MEERVKVKCIDCNKEYDVAYKTYRRHIRLNKPFICLSCNNKRTWNNMPDSKKDKRAEKISKIRKEEWKNKSDEEKNEKIKLLLKGHNNWYNNLSDEDKEKISNISKENTLNYFNSLSDEDRMRWKNNLSKSSRKRWDSMSAEDKELYSKKMSSVHKKVWDDKSIEKREEEIRKLRSACMTYWKNISEEELSKRSNDMISRWNNLSEDEKQKMLDKLKIGRDIWRNNLTENDLKKISEVQSKNSKIRWDKMTEDKRKLFSNQISKASKKFWENISDEERKSIHEKESKHRKEVWKNMSDEDKENHIKLMNSKYREWIDELTYDDREKLVSKRFKSSQNMNKLHEQFENKFKHSNINDAFYYVSEYPTSNKTIHCWDYAVFDQNGELECLVDLDGVYFHGDLHDYDGIHSREEYDEQHGLSIPDGVKWCIINEDKFDECFNYLEKIIPLSYDEFLKLRFKEYRNMPFPQPHYSDKDLLKSYEMLCRMNCTDKYHQDLSLNTRLGDRIIQHFHTSLYDDIQQVWNSNTLKELIKEHAIYQSYLNRNKILQGLNVSSICPNKRFISPGKCKMIINKYLSEYNEIFDPFSGFSGRMLGAISLGKQYIGQDLSEVHVRESNQIIDFLNKYGIKMNVDVQCKDSVVVQGEYECLFTYLPSNDELIDICLKNYKCKRYLFVVDETDKYKNNVVDIIHNKSYSNTNDEYIIIIEGAS